MSREIVDKRLEEIEENRYPGLSRISIGRGPYRNGYS